MGKNVLIPLELFNQTLDVMEKINASGFDYCSCNYFQTVLSAFRLKKHTIFQRRLYSEMIFSENEDDRAAAHIMYQIGKEHKGKLEQN